MTRSARSHRVPANRSAMTIQGPSIIALCCVVAAFQEVWPELAGTGDEILQDDSIVLQLTEALERELCRLTTEKQLK